ncbi:hypothetical protein KFK09_002115 [Dendrobium nobile]|uniref:Uncharacterized protein n=1 Tax=Dendrobium nobile TaxID=94219 RepID=A0A8T3C711_DENNO|nr:hypothetical protein KFK09_002115 [Dendrobium nobile]
MDANMGDMDVGKDTDNLPNIFVSVDSMLKNPDDVQTAAMHSNINLDSDVNDNCEEGEIILTGKKKDKQTWNITKRDIMEVVSEFFSEVMVFLTLVKVCVKIRMALSTFTYTMKHVLREGNACANWLAKLGSKLDEEKQFELFTDKACLCCWKVFLDEVVGIIHAFSGFVLIIKDPRRFVLNGNYLSFLFWVLYTLSPTLSSISELEVPSKDLVTTFLEINT